MAEDNTQSAEHAPSAPQEDPMEPKEGTADVLPLQQGSLPAGRDFSSAEPVGGSKPDPVSTGPNVEDSIAGRN
jgi:hypothetical protein